MSGLRDRCGEVLFIDARRMGALMPGSRKQKELSREEIQKIATAYHAWRGEPDAGEYEDVAGFCKSATTEEIVKHNFVLTPAAMSVPERWRMTANPLRRSRPVDGAIARTIRRGTAAREGD